MRYMLTTHMTILLGSLCLIAQAEEEAPQTSKKTPSRADDSFEETRQDLADVVVTAKRTDPGLRNVKAHTSVLSGSDLQGINSTLDLDGGIAGLTVREAGDRKSPFLALRGLPNTPFGEHTVAVYVDDVPASELRTVLFDLYAVERVEVLRGPQTTRFGKNNETGVINVTTRGPEVDFSAHVEARYGNYDTFRTEGFVNIPLAPKKAQMLLSGVYSQRDGYIKNTFRGSSVDQRESMAGRVKLHFSPTEGLDLMAMAEAQHASDGPQAFVLLSDGNPFNVTNDTRGQATSDSYLGALRIKYSAPWFQLTSITTRRNVDIDHVQADLDFSSQPIMNLHDEHTFTQWSQEFRFASTDRFGKWDWFAGLYFEDRHTEPELGFSTLSAPFISILGLPFSPPVQQRQIARLHHKTLSLFGDATYAITKRWDIAFGLRAEIVRTELHRQANFTAWSDGVVIRTAQNVNRDAHSAVLLPKATVSYRPHKNMLTYVSYTKGNRPAGFSYGADPGFARFDSEHLHNLEAGLKTNWLQDRLTFDASLYYMSIRDYQVRRLTGVSSVVIGAEMAHSMGMDLDFTARPLNGLTLHLGLGLNNAEFDDFDDPATGRRFDGNTINMARKYDLSASVQYKHSTGFFVRGEFLGVGEYPFLEDNLKKQGAFEVVNAKIGYTRDRFGVYLYGQNLFNRTYYHFALISPSGTDYSTTPGAPQTFGMLISVDF